MNMNLMMIETEQFNNIMSQLDAINKYIAKEQAKDEIYTCKEVQDKYKIGRTTLNNWFDKGLKKKHVGNVIRISNKDLQSFLNKQKG